jgi:ABC-type branched-subunit amino acid transport system substrate-binding protein
LLPNIGKSLTAPKAIGRRQILKTGAALGAGFAAPAIFTSHAWAAGYTNEPKGGSVTLGFNVPKSGTYADEGAEQLRAYGLAVKHINGEGDGGMLRTFSSKALQGNGINGKKVDYVSGDTQLRSEVARASARRMIEEERAVMISGGSSSGVAIAVQSLCQDAGVIFMAGLTHSNDTTGKFKRANGFRHFFNTEMSGAALAPVLRNTYGPERLTYHLTTDYSWGWSQEGSIRKYTEKLGWKTHAAVRTPLGVGDYSRFIRTASSSGADVLILNQYGTDMVNSLTQAVRSGLLDKQVNSRNFAIVVPIYNRRMAQNAGNYIDGVLGSVNWHWSLQDRGSKAFVKSFSREYGSPPSQAAHTAYCQVILYADACQRAGTFRPSAVGKALEDFEFDGLGNGPSEYRSEDHQCFKSVLVVKGKQNPSSRFDHLEIAEVTPRAKIEYPADILGGQLGPYNDGEG